MVYFGKTNTRGATLGTRYGYKKFLIQKVTFVLVYRPLINLRGFLVSKNKDSEVSVKTFIYRHYTKFHPEVEHTNFSFLNYR